MLINEYVELASRTRVDLDEEALDTFHMLLGLMTEIGELADVFKKNLAYGKKMDDVNIREEIGDILWYLANLCDVRGYNLEEIMRTNISKLMIRYPEKYSNHKAINRNIEKERKVLESKPSFVEKWD